MEAFKKKMHDSDKDDQYKMLTCVPDSWSINRIVEYFNVPQYMARKSKLLRRDFGPYSAPDSRKPGKCLSDSLVNAVKDFYCSDEISRCLPGKKDYVSVRVDGERKHLQKRLLLSTCREAHILFKEQYPNLKIGISAFTKLRPKVIILKVYKMS